MAHGFATGDCVSSCFDRPIAGSGSTSSTLRHSWRHCGQSWPPSVVKTRPGGRASASSLWLLAKRSSSPKPRYSGGRFCDGWASRYCWKKGQSLRSGSSSGCGPVGACQVAQAAGLLDLRAEHPASQVGRERHDAVHRARPRQFVDERTEAADGNAHEPDRLVALGALRLDDLGVEAIAQRLFVVVGNIRVHQQGVCRQMAFAHSCDEPFALELVGLQVRPGQEHQERVGLFVGVGGLKVRFHGAFGAPEPHRSEFGAFTRRPRRRKF